MMMMNGDDGIDGTEGPAVPLVCRASFAMGSDGQGEAAAVVLPSTGDAARTRADVVAALEDGGVPAPYADDIAARVPELLQRHQLAEMRAALLQAGTNGSKSGSAGARAWAEVYRKHTTSTSSNDDDDDKDKKGKNREAAQRRRGAMFHVVINDRRENVEAVLGAEERCVAQMRGLADARAQALQDAQTRHAAEMARLADADAGTGADVDAAVARQMRELQDIEAACDAREAAAAQQQDRQYWRLVAEIFGEKVARDMCVVVREAPRYRDINAGPLEASSSATTTDESEHEYDFDEYEDDVEDEEEDDKGIYERDEEAEAAASSRRGSVAQRLFERVSMDPALLRTRLATVAERCGGRACPSDSTMLFIGPGQRKVLYRLDVVCAPLVPVLVDNALGTAIASNNKQQQRRREETMKRLYSRALSALVVPTVATERQWEWQSAETPLERRVREACAATHDFHFGSLRQQIAAWQDTAATTAAAAAAPLAPGDVFTTKHSNLLDTHVVFHMVVDRDALDESATRTTSTALQGLWNVLSLASHYDVSELTVPVPLVPAQPPSDCPPAAVLDWYQQQGDIVLNNIKEFLSLYNPEGITHITLVFPETAPDALPAAVVSNAF